MRRRVCNAFLITASLIVVTPLAAQGEPDLILEGELADDGVAFDAVTFDVPAGIGELEIAHDDLSERNILDWGLYDPERFRGWGGGNSENIVLNADAASRSYLPGPILPGTWQVVIGEAKILDTPAQYRIEVWFRDDTTLAPRSAREPYEKASPLQDEARYYAGDFHVHSEESGDANASFSAIADFAEASGLDFVVVTDHNTDAAFSRLNTAQRNSDVLIIPGIELTTYAGHIGVYGPSAYIDHRLPLDLQVAAYVQQGAVVAINHPVLELGDACIGCAFTSNIPPELLAVEIQTGASTLFTQDALAFWDGITTAADNGSVDGGPGAQAIGAYGAVGGSDDHRAGQDLGIGQSPIGSPTTQVLATSLSHDAILAGVRAGKTTVQLGGIDGPMIEMRTASAADAATASARTTAADGAQFYWVVNGRYEDAQQISSDDETFTREFDVDDFDTLGRSGDVGFFGAQSGGRNIFVRAEVWRGDTPAAVTGHQAAVAERPADEPTCGCQETSSPTAVPTAAVFVVALGALTRRRRRRN